MKKLFSSFIIVAALGMSSCKEFLNTSPESQFVPGVVFGSTGFANNAITGIYSLMTTDQGYSQSMPLVYCNNSDIEWIGADNGSYNAATYRGLSNYLGTAGNDALEKPWNNLYKIIERANLAIEGIKASPVLVNGTVADKALMNAYMGEALALRAQAYFDLVRAWGDVPFKTESTQSDGSNFYLEATDRDVIMDALIKDLEEAATLVPWIGEGASSSAERITKDYIKGLIARIALTRGGYSIRNKTGYPTERGTNYLDYYKIANQACLDVINSGKHRLNPSFRNVWTTVNQWKQDIDYREPLFEIALGYQRSGEMGYSIGVRFYANDKYGFGNNANMVNTGAYYYYMFDRNDLRKDATIAYYQYSNSGKDQKEFFKNNPMDWNFAKWDQRMMSSSFLDANRKANGKIGYGINWIMMRYSDILLMFAETENEINGAPTAAARQALKDVRSRAFSVADQAVKVDQYVNSLGSKDDFFNALVDERAFEFGGEGIRKYDLIRWNLLAKKIQEQKDGSLKILKGENPNPKDPTIVIPRALFYEYNATGATDEINKNTINMYEDKGILDITGFTKVNWGSNTGTNTVDYTNRINNFSSGLNIAVSNRHLFPYAATVVNESNGKLKNSYGF